MKSTTSIVAAALLALEPKVSESHEKVIELSGTTYADQTGQFSTRSKNEKTDS